MESKLSNIYLIILIIIPLLRLLPNGLAGVLITCLEQKSVAIFIHIVLSLNGNDLTDTY